MPAQARNALLRVVRGDDHGKGWDLVPGQTYTVGRSHKCNLSISDRTASGRHAQIECRQGVWMVSDLDSSHGTRVNRQRILAPKPLFDRDAIQCGKTLLEFREYEALAPDDLAEIDKGLDVPE